MARASNPNLEILTSTVDQLEALADEMVFVGGCATGLLITDPASPPIRVTMDVDAIVQVASRAEYYQLSEKLRHQGFNEDMSEDAPICRWLSGGLILDVMPTDASLLGFGNEWYLPAMQHAQPITLASGKTINMIAAPYFLITKLEAFTGRGGEDYQASHDMEDIIAVIDGRPELFKEIRNASDELIIELAWRCRELLVNKRFVEAIFGHMPGDSASQGRVPGILEKLKQIAVLG